MKIAYVLTDDPHDKRSWSGTCYSLLCQLERFFEVDVVRIDYEPTLWERLAMSLRRRWASLAKRDVGPERLYYARAIGREVSARIATGNYDAVFLLGMENGAYAKIDIPVVYYSDCTFHLMVDYYYHGFSREAIRNGERLQRRVLENSNVCMFSSDWAKDDAISHYGIPSERCVVAHLGANVEVKNLQRNNHPKSTVNLLFIGAEWERKGGDIALDCVKQLNAEAGGVSYVLHIVGSQPPFEITDSNVRLHGFLDRNDPKQAAHIEALCREADLFILPTLAECAGIVFCEASAYGIPILTYDTGGIGSYVVNGENGYRLPIQATARDFADMARKLLSSPAKLAYMQRRAVELYKDHLNWDALGEKIWKVIVENTNGGGE